MLLLKKIISVIVAAFVLLPCLAFSANAAAPGGSSECTILIHADSGEVLYERNADQRMLVASTTKIMTAIVALESCELDEVVKIDSRSAGIEGSSMYLKAGEKYSVEQLLYGLMLVSGNDAAIALALHVSDSIEDFAQLMNEKAQELGMTASSFMNPHGLDEDGHYSTARDMATLAAYCMENEDFYSIVSSKSKTVGDQTLHNHNKLLASYDGCIGLKTGYTKAAGRSLVSCAERNGARYICVTLNDPDDWRDHAALYDWAFASIRCEKVISREQTYSVPVVSGAEMSVSVAPDKDVAIILDNDAVIEYHVELPRFVFSPVEEGQTAGRIVAFADGAEICSEELYYQKSIDVEPGIALTPSERFRRAWALAGHGRPYYLIGVN